jgi:sulfotransferase
MICMVRDLRSVIASFERIYRKTRHLPVGTDNPAQMSNMTVGERVGCWLKTQPVGLALQRTADAFQRGLGRKILFVRYEDLCAKPQPTMDLIYQFIGEPKFKHDFSNISKQVEEDDSHFGVYGSHSVRKELHPASPGDWSDVLPKEIANQIKRDNQWYFDTFNY